MVKKATAAFPGVHTYLHAVPQQSQQKTQQERWTSCQTTGSPGFALHVQSVSGTFDQAFPEIWQLRHEVFCEVLLQMAVGGCPGCQVPASLSSTQKNLQWSCVPENLHPVSRVSQQAVQFAWPRSTPDRLQIRLSF